MKNKKILILTFVVLAIATNSFSQDKDSEQKKPKLFKWKKKNKETVYKKNDFRDPKHSEKVYERKFFIFRKRKS